MMCMVLTYDIRLPLGVLSLTVRGKALYLSKQHATDGYGVVLVGGFQFPINLYFPLYGICDGCILQLYH
ncbi:MAG: YfaZ family outer membrane protein [Candidatus Malihini olakiniferum]